MKRQRSKASRGLETRRIVYGNRRYPHQKLQELTVDVRCGEVLDMDCATAMVAARTTVPLAEVLVVRIIS